MPDPAVRSITPAPNFDRIARVYRWAEYLCLGPLLRRTREHFLPELRPAYHVLVLGDGDGRFSAKMLRMFPSTRIFAMDISRGMLDLLRRRCSFASHRVQTCHADIAALPRCTPIHHYDVIVSHFFLDCLAQSSLDTLVSTVAEDARPGLVWLISDFGLPHQQPWRWLGQLYVDLLYRAFGRLTGLRAQALPDIAGTLQRFRFRRLLRYEQLGGLLYSELWTVDAVTET